MSFTKEVIIERFDRGGKKALSDFVISEERIAFYLNGEKLLSVMSVPHDQDAHFVGFLLSEGVIKSPKAVRSIAIRDGGLSVYLDAEIDEEARGNLFREKTLTSGCCVGVTGNVDGKIECDFVDTDYRVPIGALLGAIEEFMQSTSLFSKTGCTHRASLCLENGLIFSAEDIGRHNAIDKAAGRARMEGCDITRSFLLASGRLSMEMVVKCVMHRIPIVVSKAAVTLQGVRSAQEYGITLAGFAREGRVNLYTHSGRIVL
ncbi:sulfurtransferase FdhD [Campylobacterota bacterium]|nr:sulfurtransferase FdhD [Campylobacterota bacterium]GHV07568.1 sulfurtransferase FdhD [Campylobacterota bacterium]